MVVEVQRLLRLARSASTHLVPPLALYLFLVHEPARTSGLLLTVCVAILIVPFIVRHPTAAICALLVLLPFQVPVFASLYAHGLPAGLVRQLGAAKDLLLLGLLLRAMADRPLLDWRPLERWILGFTSIATAYLITPALLPGLTDVPLGQRFLAWRTAVFFLLLLLAIYRMDARVLNVNVLTWVIIGTSALVAAGALYEQLSPTSWQHFLYVTCGIPRYSLEILGNPLGAADLLRFAANGHIRSGSVIREPVFAGFYLLPGLFLALTKIPSKIWLLPAALTGLIGAGVVATGTRSALLVAMVGVIFAAASVLRTDTQHAQVFAPVLMVLLMFCPAVIAGSTVSSRLAQAIAGEDASTRSHQNDVAAGLRRAVEEPLGTGLGTGAGTGQRFRVQGQVTTENAYLQVINELGVAALIAFIAVLALLLIEVVGLPRLDARGHLQRAGGIAVIVAMVLGGLFQTVWLSFVVAVTAIVAAALPLVRHRQIRPVGETVLPNQAMRFAADQPVSRSDNPSPLKQ